MGKKVYYKTEFTSTGPMFVGQDGSKIYFAGGGEYPKYIIQSLTKVHGEEKAKEIYYSFLEGLDEIKNLETGKNFKFPTASLVLYQKDNDKDGKRQGKNKETKRYIYNR